MTDEDISAYSYHLLGKLLDAWVTIVPPKTETLIFKHLISTTNRPPQFEDSHKSKAYYVY